MKWYDNWIEVFKSGTHTDSAGNTRAWSNDDLDKIVANYDPAQDEAPVVLGHPKTDEPAYGWVSDLKRDGDVLLAKLTKVCPEFANWVESGLYRKISVALGSDFSLRHIGFLGAANPAVKGLCNDFSDNKKVVYIEKNFEKPQKPCDTSDIDEFSETPQTTQEFSRHKGCKASRLICALKRATRNPSSQKNIALSRSFFER